MPEGEDPDPLRELTELAEARERVRQQARHPQPKPPPGPDDIEPTPPSAPGSWWLMPSWR